MLIMNDLIDVLIKLYPKKYWILGITLTLTMTGFIIKMNTYVKHEFKTTVEFNVVNIPENVKTDFSKFAIQFIKNEDIKSYLRQAYALKDVTLNLCFGLNKSICFSMINTDTKLAKEILNELVTMYNREVNEIIKSTSFNTEISQTDVEHNYIDIVKFPESENVLTPIQIVRSLIIIFVFGLFLSMILFLVLDLAKSTVKSFRKALLNAKNNT